MDIAARCQRHRSNAPAAVARAAGARLVSIHQEAIFPTRAFQAGARGYVTKASAPEVLVGAVALSQAASSSVPTWRRRLHCAMSRSANALAPFRSRIRDLAPARWVIRFATSRKAMPHLQTIANYRSSIRLKLGADVGAIDPHCDGTRLDGRERPRYRIATPHGNSPTGISAIFVLVSVSITATALERPQAT